MVVTRIQKGIRQVVDAITTGDLKAAENAFRDYAKYKAVQFSEWQDNTKSPTLHLDWENTDELYDIFTEYCTD